MFKLKNKRKVSINKICRACLTERGHLRDIFSTKIPRMLQTVTSVQISEGDGLPPNICITCFHLVAKFYTFRKKIERNDKLLRSHYKNIEKDILDIAVNDAQIENDSEKDEIKQDVSQTTEDDASNEYSSEEDIPLSERILVKGKPTNCDKKTQIKEVTSDTNRESKSETTIDQNMASCSENSGSDFENKKQSSSNLSNDFIESLIGNSSSSVTSQMIYTEGPPPLIPLVPKTTSVEEKSDSIVTLPDDPPPLIPIKHLVNPDSLLTIMKQPPELKLLCSGCNEEFDSIEALKQHKLNDCPVSDLQCNICKKEFKERKKLIGHLKGHMIVKGYGCKICGKKYPNPSTFKVHMRTHTGERPFKCEVCGKGFIRWAGVVGHLKTHQTHKPYKCPTCGKGFKISSNLERHKILHSGILPYCCNYCGKTFSQSDNLQLHIRTYHTNERPYLCNECGKGFVSSTRLNRHMWVHTGYKPYLCKSCPKAYSNSNDLKNHERTHTGDVNENDKPYACTVCEMRFYHPCRLNKHMKTHVRPHACTSCPKTFSSTRLLNKHISNKHGANSQPEVAADVEGDEEQYVEEVVIKDGDVFIDYDSCQI